MATAVQAPQPDPNRAGSVLKSDTTSASQTHIFRLLGYYIAIVVAAGTVLVLLLLDKLFADPAQHQVARAVAFVACGALIGNVLYSIRQLHRHYLKDQDYDPRWVGKYVTGPWEAAALAVLVYSLIRGESALFSGAPAESGSTAMNGSGTSKVLRVDDFGLFGLGGLIGFGMRDVVGWLAGVAAHMFPNNSAHPDERSKQKPPQPSR
jgi:hypothetical protein